MARFTSPPKEEVLNLPDSFSNDELQVFKFFDASLPESWEIYIRPHLNGLCPSIVLLHPYKGIAVYEIVDWELEKKTYSSSPRKDETPLLTVEEEKQEIPLHLNPVEQIYSYRRELLELYCPRLDRSERFLNITGGLSSQTPKRRQFYSSLDNLGAIEEWISIRIPTQ